MADSAKHRILLPLIQMILSLAYLAGWGIIAGLMITDVPANFVPAQAGRIWANCWGTEGRLGRMKMDIFDEKGDLMCDLVAKLM